MHAAITSSSSPVATSRRRRRLAAVAVAIASVVGTSWARPPTVAATLPVQVVNIESHDGVTIPAIAWTPSGPGPHPIIVMPASWSSINIQYTGTAAQWAAQGYVVVTYTARGWGGPSAGLIDIAGPDTVRDVSEVIDWAVENADGDPERVGAIGVSYGAGISLLAAASEHEDRIDAVVALSTWSSLAGALYPNETLNSAAIDLLLGAAIDGFLGAPGPLLEQIAAEYDNGVIDTGLATADVRSPISNVDRLNERGVAVMIGNAWSDTIFAPSGAVELFEALTGPRKLALSPGDHGGPELGALGIPTQRLDQAFRWLQQHVAEVATDTGPVVEVTTNDLDRVQLSAGDFDELARSEQTYYLEKPRRERVLWWRTPKHGETSSRPDTGWSTSIHGGRSSVADSQSPVPAIVSGYLHGLLGIAPTIIPATLDRSNAVVWETGRLWNGATIAGSPELSITLRPDDEDTTFFVYLYEKNIAEVATLVTHKAFTVRDATPGDEVDLDIELEPTVWDVERGSRLYLVIDTVDPRYRSETTGGTVRFVSPDRDAAALTVPFN